MRTPSVVEPSRFLSSAAERKIPNPTDRLGFGCHIENTNLDQESSHPLPPQKSRVRSSFKSY